MSWTYRIVKRTYHAGLPNEESVYQIHETYGDPGKLSITTKPCDPHGETKQELRADLYRMVAAFNKPVLDYFTLADVEP